MHVVLVNIEVFTIEMHECPKGCGQSFEKKQNLTKHINQKISCDSPDRKYPCPNSHCHLKFLSSSSRCHHLKVCKPKETKDSLRQDNMILREALACVGGHITNNITQNNHTNNIDNSITLNIHVNCFGQENKEHIQKLTIDGIRELLSNTDEDRPLREFVKLLRMNPEYPENHNVRIPNEKRNVLMKKTKDGWANVEAVPNGLWSVAAVDFFDLKDLALRLIKREECGELVDWIKDTEKKIQNSSYKHSGELVDIIERLKKDFSDFTRVAYLVQNHHSDQEVDALIQTTDSECAEGAKCQV